MSKYKVTFKITVPQYVTVEVEANTAHRARQLAKKEAESASDWETCWEEQSEMTLIEMSEMGHD